MAKTMSCRDVGPDCDFKAKADTEEELMAKVAEHARVAHGIENIPPEMGARVKAAIREE